MKQAKIALKNLIDIILSGNFLLVYKTFLNYTTALLKLDHSSLPIEVQVEPSSICNLKCLMCNLDKSNNPNKFLTPQNFTKILGEIKPLRSINFTGMGESLLNPYIIELIRIAKSQKLSVSLISNGQLLNNKVCDDLINIGLDSMAISIESGIPKSYESIRRGGKFFKLKKNLIYLSKKNKLSIHPINIIFNVVLIKDNILNLNHIFKIIDLANTLNIKQISFQNSNIPTFKLSKSKLVKKYSSITNYANKHSINVILPKDKIIPGSCLYPWVYPQITASGELLPCCLIPQFGAYSKIISEYSFGNIFQNNFNKIWNNNHAISFRKNLRTNPISYCQNCTKYKGIL